MKFSIITPSSNMLDYLKCCSASINDQKETEFEHIIMDGNSSDGTKEWMLINKNAKSKSEQDKGMYDAINNGLKIADGDIISYLNCDEQYLPGTLSKVKKFFTENKDIDIVFGHALITDINGKLLAYRKAYRPNYSYIITSILYNLSCTMFFRKKIINDGFRFNQELKVVGDADFVLRLLEQGYKASYINDYLSVFTWTGQNLSLGENAKKEEIILKNSAPVIIRNLKPIITVIRLLEKYFSGAYFQKFPLKYSIYLSDTSVRKEFLSNSASFRWPKN